MITGIGKSDELLREK